MPSTVVSEADEKTRYRFGTPDRDRAFEQDDATLKEKDEKNGNIRSIIFSSNCYSTR